MINIEQSYDAEREALLIIYKNNLLRKHSNILEEEVRKSNLPKNSAVEKGDNNSSRIISIPVRSESVQAVPGVMSVALPFDVIEKIDKIFERFVINASLEELKNLSVISLEGFPKNEFKDYIEDTISNKKDLCIIENYQDYLEDKNVVLNKKQIKEALFKYGTNDYCNVILSCLSKDFEELKNLTEPKLKVIEWM